MGQSPPSTEYSLSPDDGLPFLQGTADFGPQSPVPRVYCGSPTKVAAKGDILFSVRAPVGELNLADQEAGIGRGLCAIRPSATWFSRFAWWAIHEARDQLNHVSTGSTYEAVATEDVANLPIEDTDLEAQHAIADYLDRETARLDGLVAEKERVLKLLTEKRRAIASHAVTRGINPSAHMKDTGIQWLGIIPASWETKRVKYVFRMVAEAAPEDNDYELLALYTDIGVRPRRELEARGNKATSTDNYWIVRPGDLVVNKLLAWMGAFGVSEYEGVTSPAYDILRPASGVNSTYYHHLFRCGLCFTEFRRRSTGIMDMRLRLYFDQFGDMQVPLPPIDEQDAIVVHISAQTAKIDALRSATERTIALLKERRAALIGAAVTGKIDVPGADRQVTAMA
jgi:type I restriction enzyme S subunit